MPVTIVQGSDKKPVSGDVLALFFEVHGELNGQLYIGYPTIGTSGSHSKYLSSAGAPGMDPDEPMAIGDAATGAVCDEP